MERYDILHARKSKDGRAFWTKCGVAFPNRDGTGWNLTLNYLPAPISNEGYQFAMLPPKPRDGQATGGGANVPPKDEDQDSVPF